MNTMQDFRRRVEAIFRPYMNYVIDTTYEDVTDMEEPAEKPRLRMLQTVQTVHIEDEDYGEMRALILAEPNGQFRVVYEMDSCNLVLYGFIDRYDSLGDGYNAPREEIEEINVYAYECLDADGDDLDTDFDPTRLQQSI